jgi:AAA domain
MSSTAPIVPFPVVRAADLKHVVTPLRWLVEPLWAHNGVGVLGGAPKSCKSFLALDLAVSVASGTACLDTFGVPTAGPVLVYFAEDPAEVVYSRLAELCLHRQLALDSLPLWVLTPPSIRLDLVAEQRRLEADVQTYKPRLLVLDPFVRLHRIDENDAGQVSGVLAFLRSLQRTYHMAVLLVHHTRKNGPAGQQAGLGLRGSGDLHAWGDSNLYLRKVRDHLALTVEHRACRPPAPMTLSLVGGGDQGPAHLELTPPSDVSDAPSPQNLAAAVLQQLAQAQAPLVRSALRKSLQVRNERLGEVLSRLLAEHRIVRVADGYALKADAIPIPCIRECGERNASDPA